MELRTIFALVGLLATTAVVADAYRWVDENGVVTYSDREEPGAERVNLRADRPPTQTYASARADSASAAERPQDAAKPFRYESISIANPGPEVTLWDIGGVLDVSLSVSPALQSGHQVRVYLDGGSPQVVTGTNFQLEEVFRGVHNLQAEVIDQTGKLMIRSQPNRFYVQQNVIRR